MGSFRGCEKGTEWRDRPPVDGRSLLPGPAPAVADGSGFGRPYGSHAEKGRPWRLTLHSLSPPSPAQRPPDVHRGLRSQLPASLHPIDAPFPYSDRSDGWVHPQFIQIAVSHIWSHMDSISSQMPSLKRDTEVCLSSIDEGDKASIDLQAEPGDAFAAVMRTERASKFYRRLSCLL